MTSYKWKIIAFLLLFSGNLNLSNCQVVKLMTYNIRYDNAGDKENKWDLRKQYLTDQIKFYEPGILGIQEGLHHQVKYIDSCLSDYKLIGVGRNDGKTKGEYSAIFYKNKHYKISGHFIIDFSRIVSAKTEAEAIRKAMDTKYE